MASSKLDIIISVIDKASAQMKGIAGSIKRNEDQIRSAGRGLTVFGAGVTALGGLGVKAAVDFETAFAGVVKTVNASQTELDELSAGFRELATEIPVTVEELAAIGETAGQLGIATDNILDFTKVMADLGVTTNLTSEEAATAMARIANVTGLPQDQFDQLGSALVDLGNNLATTEAEILTFAQRIAGAGNIAGLAESDILAIGGAMSSVGVKAEAGGTAVQKVLIAMTDAANGTGENLAEFAEVAGLTAEQFAQAFQEDAAAAFTSFVEGLGQSGDDAFAVLEELGLQDQRLIRSFLSLANAGDLLTRSIDLGTQAFAENEALSKEAEQRYATTASQMKILMNTLNELFITLGEALVPVLKDVVASLTPVIQRVSEWMKDNPTLASTIIKVAGAVGIFAVALGPLLIMLPGLVTAIGGLKIALIGLGTASTGPIGLVLAGIGLAAGAFFALRGQTEELDEATSDLAATYQDELIPTLSTDVPKAAENTIKSLGMIQEEMGRKKALIGATAGDITGITQFGPQRGGVLNLLGDQFDKVTESADKSQEALNDAGLGIGEVASAARIATTDFSSWARSTQDVADQLAFANVEITSMTTGIRDQESTVAAANDVWSRLGIPLVDTTQKMTEMNTAAGRAQAVIDGLAADRALRDALSETTLSVADARRETNMYSTILRELGVESANAFAAGLLSEKQAADLLVIALRDVADATKEVVEEEKKARKFFEFTPGGFAPDVPAGKSISDISQWLLAKGGSALVTEVPAADRFAGLGTFADVQARIAAAGADPGSFTSEEVRQIAELGTFNVQVNLDGKQVGEAIGIRTSEKIR